MDVPRFRTYVEEVPDHVCDLNTRLYVEMAVFGTEHPTGTERFFRSMRLASIVSRRHPYTKIMFRSTASLAAEVERHMETAPNIIHPYSSFRSNYEIFMFIMYISFSVYIPLYIWKFSCLNLTANIAYSCILLSFWIDIAMNFCTGYVNKKQLVVVLNAKMIAKRYVLSYFIIDLISSFPYSFAVCYVYKNEISQKYYWIDIICALKLLRTPTMFAYYKQMAFRLKMKLVTRHIVRLLIAVSVYLNWVACFCSVVTAINTDLLGADPHEYNDTEPALWSKHVNASNPDFTWRNAMLRAITLTFTCGFRIIFTEFADMIANIIFFLLGIVVVVLVSVRIVVIARIVQMRGAQFETLKTHLEEYILHKQVPQILTSRLMDYYKFCFERTYYHEPAIIGFLSGQLQKDVLLQKGRIMMESTDLFVDVPPAIMVRLVAGLHTTVVLPGDEVMRVGDPAEKMIFVNTGTLAIYDINGTELCHIGDGQMIGEQMLVADKEVLGVTVIALEASELWELTRSYFLAVTRTPTGSQGVGPGAREDYSDVQQKIFNKLRRRREQAQRAAQREAAGARGTGRGGARARGVRRGGARPGGARPGRARPGGARAAGARPGGARPGGARPGGARPGGARPGGARPGGARPGGARPGGARPGGARPGGVRPRGARPGGARPGGARPRGARPAGARPARGRPRGARPGGARERGPPA